MKNLHSGKVKCLAKTLSSSEIKIHGVFGKKSNYCTKFLSSQKTRAFGGVILGPCWTRQDRRAITQTNVLHCTWKSVFIYMWTAFYNLTRSPSTVVLLNSKRPIVPIKKSWMDLLNKLHVLKGETVKRNPGNFHLVISWLRCRGSCRWQQSPPDMRRAGSRKGAWAQRIRSHPKGCCAVPC